MKFAIINDAHIGPSESGFEKGIHRKLVNQSETILASVITTLNQAEKPELVINLGDSIEDVNDRQVDIRSFNQFLSLVAPIAAPIYHSIG
ncbi:hypothetical protein COX09_03220, partial [Candidatus Beckwithbacteria bacterium CG23_combo_of_CG06-09_8_20_14_all_47_9]